jgi:hypothetical protein
MISIKFDKTNLILFGAFTLLVICIIFVVPDTPTWMFLLAFSLLMIVHIRTIYLDGGKRMAIMFSTFYLLTAALLIACYFILNSDSARSSLLV